MLDRHYVHTIFKCVISFVYIHIYIYVYYTYVNIHIIYTYTYIYNIHIRIYMYIYTHIYIYIHMYIYTHICTYIYIFTYNIYYTILYCTNIRSQEMHTKNRLYISILCWFYSPCLFLYYIYICYLYTAHVPILAKLLPQAMRGTA